MMTATKTVKITAMIISCILSDRNVLELVLGVGVESGGNVGVGDVVEDAGMVMVCVLLQPLFSPSNLYKIS